MNGKCAKKNKGENRTREERRDEKERKGEEGSKEQRRIIKEQN